MPGVSATRAELSLDPRRPRPLPAAARPGPGLIRRRPGPSGRRGTRAEAAGRAGGLVHETRASTPCPIPLGWLDALQAAEVGDRVRQATQTLYQELIDAEATAVIGAGPWERTEDRTAQRNGSRSRTLTTTAGDLELRIPKLRTGSFFPSLLERRRRVDQALFAVVMEAYLHGVCTRKVDDLVKALGADTGISKSEVSRICADLDEEVAAFRDRSLADTAYPVRVPGRHLLQGPGQPPGRVPGGRRSPPG